MRGKLTEKAKKIAKDFLKREITQTELRLYPYIDFVMKNAQRIEPSKITSEERKILSLLRKEGHLAGGASGLSISRSFYNYIQRILFETYVDIN